MENKNIIMLLLFIGIIASITLSPVSAETFKALCHGGSVDHEATWSQTFDQTINTEKIVIKKGVYYKVYQNLYKFTEHPCFHETHDKTHWTNGYTYESLSSLDPRGAKYNEYTYVKVKKGDRNEKIYPSEGNSKYSDTPYRITLKTTTTNFIVTHNMEFAKKIVNQDSPFTGYVTVKSINPKIKIKTIKILQGNGYKGFKWKTHKISSNKKTIKLGKNTLANLFENGLVNPPLIYVVNY